MASLTSESNPAVQLAPSPAVSMQAAAEEQEVTSHPRMYGGGGEVELMPLARQSSIYSLTLDELQNAVCEPGRNFGSMNMDEFLTNIWNAEEGQAEAGMVGVAVDEQAAGGGGGLHRQGSFSVPEPLHRKTVEEVWAEISRGQAQAHAHAHAHAQQQMGRDAGGNSRQPTLGEMTLEEFLVRAGVVREGYGGAAHQAAAAAAAPAVVPGMQQGQFGVAPGFAVAPNGVYPGMGDAAAYANGGPVVGNGYGGMVAPPPPQAGPLPGSSGSSEGMGGAQMDMMNYLEGGGMVVNGGRKRAAAAEGGTVEKVVERRQRRMIKNRESAARSRARKQAYTVELEAELNQLKEENARLRAEEKRILLARKQMLVEKMMERSRENANAKKAGRAHRRCGSCIW